MNWFAAIGVNFLTPLLGVILFVLLCREMRRRNIPSPPYFAYFILFSAYGGWLLICLTVLFWRWSGMASFGGFYLITLAPLFTAGVAITLRNERALSVFHRRAYIASIAYSALMLIAIATFCILPFFPGFLDP